MSPRIILVALGVALVFAAAAGYLMYREETGNNQRDDTASRPVSAKAKRIEPPPTVPTQTKTKPVAPPTPATEPETSKPRPAHGTVKAGLIVTVEDDKQAPVAGLQVRLLGGTIETTQETDTTGIARFSDIPSAKYQIRVHPPGAAAELYSLRRIVIPPAKTREMRIKIQRFDAVISGRVFGPSGGPVEGVEVRALPLSAGASQIVLVPTGTRPAEKTGTDGQFEITGLASSEYSVATTPRADFAIARVHVTAPANDVKLFLKKTIQLAVTGTVEDSDGNRIEGVAISVQGQAGSTKTDEQGQYRLQIQYVDSPKSRLLVVAQKDGYTPARELASLEEVGENSEVEIPFQLESVDELAIVSGQVIDQNGEPVAGERVFLRSRKLSALYSGNSDSNGKFVVEDVMAASDYRLWIYPRQIFRDYVDDAVTIEGGENSFDIQLQPFEVGALDILLVNADGAPIPGFTIRVRNTKALSRMLTLTSDKDGLVRVAEVPTGPLVVDNRTYPRLNAVGVMAAADKTVSVEIPVGIGDRSISGRVAVDVQNPLAGARVVVTWRATRGTVQSRVFQETVTDAEGRFSVGGFGNGSISVGISAEGYRAQRVDVPDEGGEGLEITLEPQK